MHFQKTFPQTKLVRVLKGEVFDVAVDLRKRSSNYGKWIGVVLSEENKKQLLIPKGFAHGFLVMSKYAEFAYKCDEFYHYDDQGGLLYNDILNFLRNYYSIDLKDRKAIDKSLQY